MAHAGGRPTKLTPELIAEAASFVDNNMSAYMSPGTIAIQLAADRAKDKDVDHPDHGRGPEPILPTIERLALHLNISRSTLDAWIAENDEFAWVVDRLRLRKADQLQQGGITGFFNPTMAKLLLSKEGYAEKSEVENSGNLTVEVVNYADSDSPSTT